MKLSTVLVSIGVSLMLMGAVSGYNDYKRYTDFDSGQPNGLIGEPEKHPCVDIEMQAKRIWMYVTSEVKTEDQLLALQNTLQKGVSEHPEYVVLQSGAQFIFDEGDAVPEMNKFIAASKAACINKFGGIADRGNV